MAIKVKNISEKIIGIGDVTILPEEVKEVPVSYETNPILEVYKDIKLITVSGKPTADKLADEGNAVQDDNEKLLAERKAKAESLKDATDEEVAALAKELGINPAECKDQADVKKKVKAALLK
jgi:hypothetical protein